MSDPVSSEATPGERTRQAEESPSSSVEAAGGVVEGRIEVRREVERAHVFAPEQLDQLAIALVERMKAAPNQKRAFGQLALEWLERIKSSRVEPANERRHLQHLFPLAEFDDTSLMESVVSKLFALLAAIGLGASTLNKIRSTGRMVIRSAQSSGHWGAANPFDLMRRAKERRRSYDTLTAAEVMKVQPHFRADKLRMFRVAVFLGLRKGELFALQKQDLDFTRGVITIRRSHGRNTTKTGNERIIPLLGAIAGDLMDAVSASPSDIVFPGEDGARQREDTKLTRALRTALGAAGVVLGYTLKCRRKGCGYSVEVADLARDADCPLCRMTLWPVPKVKPVRWYDLRHTSATLHRKAGADAQAVRVLLGHAARDTTEAVYTHLDASFLRLELSKLEKLLTERIRSQ